MLKQRKVERFGVAAGQTDVLGVADNADDDPWRTLETELERLAKGVARWPQPPRQGLVDDEGLLRSGGIPGPYGRPRRTRIPRVSK